MSLLLGQESGEETSGAAPGEEYTKGSSHLVWASVIAVLVVSAAIAAFMLLGEKPPVAAGEIVQVWACPQDVETSGFDASGASMGKESFDRVLLFAHVRLRNRSGNPLLLEIFWPTSSWRTARFRSPPVARPSTRRSSSPIPSWPRCMAMCLRLARSSPPARAWTAPSSGLFAGANWSGRGARAWTSPSPSSTSPACGSPPAPQLQYFPNKSRRGYGRLAQSSAALREFGKCSRTVTVWFGMPATKVRVPQVPILGPGKLQIHAVAALISEQWAEPARFWAS